MEPLVETLKKRLYKTKRTVGFFLLIKCFGRQFQVYFLVRRLLTKPFIMIVRMVIVTVQEGKFLPISEIGPQIEDLNS